jgi:tripartite ATP-independent transporter DctM subunit
VTLTILSLYSGLTWKKTRLRSQPFDARAAMKATWVAKWELLLPLALLGGLVLGVLRIHEAAAFTALYVLVIELVVYRELSIRDIPRVMRKCVTLVGAILIILATAIGFTAYLIQANIPQVLMGAMQSLISSKWTFLLLLNVFLLIVGMLMDIFSAIIVVVPLIAPVAAQFGINPYHLGAIFLLNLEIGYLTPPVGLNLFLSSFRFERPMSEVYRAVAPFIVVLLVCLGVVTYAPGLSTWSSRLVMPLSVGSVATEAAPPPKAAADDSAKEAAAATTQPAGLEDLEQLGAGELHAKSNEPPTLETLMRETEQEAKSSAADRSSEATP